MALGTSYIISLWEVVLFCPFENEHWIVSLRQSSSRFAATGSAWIVPESILTTTLYCSHFIISFTWTMSCGCDSYRAEALHLECPPWYLAPGTRSASSASTIERRDHWKGGKQKVIALTPNHSRLDWFSRCHQDSARLPFCVPMPACDLWALYVLKV